MPKQKITKEMVVNAAFETAKKEGIEKVTVKRIAEIIGCSVQPIYTYCANMDGLKDDIAKQVKFFVQNYVKKRIDINDPFRSTGHAYIELAKEEPNIFKIFILHKRNSVASFDDLYNTETDSGMAEYISDFLGVSRAIAKQLHLNMLIFTIGLGTIFSVSNPGIDVNEIFSCQENAYNAFLNTALNSKGDSNAE